jgi:hypothetical protein
MDQSTTPTQGRDAPPVDPRDRDAPPAPRKARKTAEDSSPNEIVHYFPEGPAPGAPRAVRARIIKLSMQAEDLRAAAAKDICTKWLPKYLENLVDNDHDAAGGIALDEVMKIAPLELPSGTYQNLIMSRIASTTFEYDIQEMWMERGFTAQDGKLSKVTLAIQGENSYGAAGPKRKYEFDLNTLVDPSERVDPRKDYGHWEVAGTGKSFHKIWVTAKPAN